LAKEGLNPTMATRLYRNRNRAVLFGVCAGVADYFGFNVSATRVLVIIGSFVSFPLIPVAYVVLGFLLPTKPAELEDPVSEPVTRRVRSDPHQTLGNVRYRFRELDARLQRLEKYVTSNRFKLDREFRQLKD
jgi:phage shock protein C